MRWSESDIRRKGLQIVGDHQEPKKKVKRISLAVKKHFCTLKFLLRHNNIAYEEEFIFHPTRKWRFDLCIPSMMIAFEYDGLAIGRNKDGKSRHTSIKGYTEDTIKINSATLLGWKVFRYTTLNENDSVKDFITLTE